MVFYAANRSLQASLELQRRCLLISTRRPAFFVSASAKRGYGSSGPVRYVPKDYNQVEKAEKIPPLEGFGKKEAGFVQKIVVKGRRDDHKLPQNFDDTDYQSNLLDDKTFRSSDFFEQAEEYSELEDAGEVSDSHGNKVAEGYERITSEIWKEAEQTAIELLAVRAFTVVELQKKLRGKKYPLNIVESVISNIKRRGLINDGVYAESFSRSRWLSSTWGPRRIKQALIQKGVSGEVANDATKHVFEGDDPNGDNNHLQHGMSKPSMDRLFVQASKQWLRGQETTLENRKARIVRWLQYRGFNWGVTSVILKKLESEYPPGE